MTSAVEIRDVTKKIGRKTIIDRLSLEIRPGEVFGLLGPNGAGKTTIIRMIVGLMSMDSGYIRIQGKDVATHFEEAIQHVGTIVENPELYKFLSGYENLRLYARMANGVTKERIDEVVRLVGLEGAIRRKVKTYSLGMRQRLGLAQALLHRPSVLVLDEPTNGLDPAGIRELRDHLRRLAEQDGVAVIVSSHLLSEMELMCDRAAIIQQGRLVRIQNIRTPEMDGGEITVLFQVDSADAALRALESLTAVAPGSEQGAVIAQTPRERVPDLNAHLVGQGIRVYGIQTIAKSLEEEFLEATRGAAHAESHTQ